MWFLYSLSKVLDYKIVPTDIDLMSKSESEMLNDDGSNFASWYRHLVQENPEDTADLSKVLNAVLPGFRQIKLIGAGRGGRYRELFASFSIEESGQSYEVAFDNLSDGQRMLIILYCLLIELRKEPGVLLLDEPENFVGLSEIQPWLIELDDALGDEGQIFIISHHPEVIDYLASKHPYQFERPGGGPVRVRKALFDRDSGLRASEQLARGLLDGD